MDFKEVLEKYGEEEVTFRSYYKYSFTFSNNTLSCGTGGDADDIYRNEVDGFPIKVKVLCPNWIEVDGVFYDGRY